MKVVSFAKNIFFTFIYFILIYIYIGKLSLIILASYILYKILKNEYESLIWLSLIVWLFFGTAATTFISSAEDVLGKVYYLLETIEPQKLIVGIIVSTIILGIINYFISNFIMNKFNKLLILLLFFSLVSIMSIYFFRLKPYAIIFMALYSKAFCYLLASEKVTSRQGILSFIPPLWSLGTVRSHLVPSNWSGIKNFINNKPKKSEMSSLRIVFYAFMFKAIALCLFSFLYSGEINLFNIIKLKTFTLNLRHIQIEGVNEFLAQNLNKFQVFLILIANALIYILREPVADSMILVSIIWMFGLNIPLNCNKPFLATSFNEFYSRTYYYYSQMILIFLFTPLFESYINNKFKKIKICFLISFSVIFGGLILNYFRHDYLIIKHGSLLAFDLVLGKTLYLSLVALASVLSYLKLFNDDALLLNSKVYRFTKVTFIFMAYAVIYNLQGSLSVDNFESRITLLTYFVR